MRRLLHISRVSGHRTAVGINVAVHRHEHLTHPFSPVPSHDLGHMCSCFRCKQVEPKIADFPSDFPQILFIRVDVDEVPVSQQQLHVRAAKPSRSV